MKTLEAHCHSPPEDQPPDWSWARLLGRVFDLDMATCLPPLCGRREPCDLSFCRRGSLRIIATITQEGVITRILRHLKLAAVPPPIAPARCRQAICAFAYPHDMVRGLVGDVRAAEAYLTPFEGILDSVRKVSRN